MKTVAYPYILKFNVAHSKVRFFGTESVAQEVGIANIAQRLNHISTGLYCQVLICSA